MGQLSIHFPSNRGIATTSLRTGLAMTGNVDSARQTTIFKSYKLLQWMDNVILCRRVQHIFDEDAITRCGVIYQNVGHGADELAVLENGAAAHE